MLIEATKPLTVRLPERELYLKPGYPVDLPDDQAKKLIERASGKVRAIEAAQVIDTGRDAQNSIVGVKIGGSLVGDFWLCLSETEPFDPGDGLPVYRPSEIRALKGKGYVPEALQAVHQAKAILDGRITTGG